MALRTIEREHIGSIYHRDRPFKHIENSKRGAHLAVAEHFDGIDWDLQITRDGVIVVCHDGQPLLQGFFDPLHLIPHDARIRDLSWRQVRRLRARTGARLYRIRRVEQMLRIAHRRDLVAVLEPKSDRRFSLDWVWQHIAAVAQTYGATASVRALAELRGAEHVAAARRAGFHAWTI